MWVPNTHEHWYEEWAPVDHDRLRFCIPANHIWSAGVRENSVRRMRTAFSIGGEAHPPHRPARIRATDRESAGPIRRNDP
jgi:hypothetical protein